MSDTVVIVNSVLTFLGTVFTGVMAYLLARLKKGQDDAAVEVAEVKKETASTKKAVTEQLTEITDTSRKIETLVNNQTSILKKDRAADKARIAELTGRPEDARAAELARQASDEHEVQQAKVDARDARDAR